MDLRTIALYQIGRRDAVLAVASNRNAPVAGLVLVLVTAIPRSYDQTLLLQDPFAWLRPVGFSLLSALLGSQGRVYTRAELVERTWGSGHHITDRTIDSHIRRVRRKFSVLGADAIETGGFLAIARKPG